MNYNNTHPQPPPIQDSFSIPVKICDGLFMADRHIAQDVEFFQTNLISHVINCAGQEVSNCRKVADVAFLTFDWCQNSIQNITQQKVVSVTVNFIEECRRNAGCLLIHYSQSQSRPFCLLACYFMIKYKWSLFKTLQFLNSRKEDVELQPAFFQQLTSFSQKLQEKGLIRSKIWTILPSMSDEEIILTNTYCNSKNKFINDHNNGNKRPSSASSKTNKNSIGTVKKNIQWKKDLVIEHVYSPNTAIMMLNEGKNNAKINNMSNIDANNEGVRAQRILSANTSNNRTSNNNQSANKQPQPNTNTHQHTKQSSSMPKQSTNTVATPVQSITQSNSSSAEMNVTKKWAQLRQMWLKEKQNYHNQQNSNTNTSLICKKEGQRINDRLQDKLNILKKHEQKMNGSGQRNSNMAKKKKQNNNDKGNKQTKDHSLNKQPNINNENANNNNTKTSNNNSRIMHNNWIIDNHHIINQSAITTTSNQPLSNTTNNYHRNSQAKIINNKQLTPNNGNQQPTNNNPKSVIIVKPNHDNSNAANNSRSSLRKVTNSQRKQDKQNCYKDNNVPKFFRNQVADIINQTKGRSNSAKPQRKDNSIVNAGIQMGLTKNSSLKGKGKWKF